MSYHICQEISQSMDLLTDGTRYRTAFTIIHPSIKELPDEIREQIEQAIFDITKANAETLKIETCGKRLKVCFSTEFSD